MLHMIYQNENRAEVKLFDNFFIFYPLNFYIYPIKMEIIIMMMKIDSS